MLSLPARTSALADCVDINADPADRLTAIAHINDERAGQLIAGRPWRFGSKVTALRDGRNAEIVPLCVKDAGA